MCKQAMRGDCAKARAARATEGGNEEVRHGQR